MAAPADGATHAEYYVPEERLYLVDGSDFAVLGMAGILGTPVCVTVHAVFGRKRRVRVEGKRHTDGSGGVKRIPRSEVPFSQASTRLAAR